MDIRGLVKDIHKGKHIERNLEMYKKEALNCYRDYSALELVFSGYTLAEELQEEKSEYVENEKEILSRLKQGMLSVTEDGYNRDEVITSMKEIREEVTEKMDYFTAYTDRFICYEYVLNRLEPKYLSTKEQKEKLSAIDESVMMQKLLAYMFQSQDQATITECVRSVVTQLPVRLTKSKFFERLAGTLTLYKGGDYSALKDYVYMLRTSGMLYEPKEIAGNYGNFQVPLEHLQKADYSELSKDEYEGLVKDLEEGAKVIHDVTDFYYSIQKVANCVYAVALCGGEDREISELHKTSMNIVKQIVAGDTNPEELIPLEGKIERFVEDTSYMEAVLFDCKAQYPCELFDDLAIVANLLSGSLFIDVNSVNEEHVAETEDVQKMTEELVHEFEKKFDQVGKPVKRAIMAQIVGKMPVLFKTSDEVKSYIDTNLFHCQDKVERLAVYEVLNELMKED